MKTFKQIFKTAILIFTCITVSSCSDDSSDSPNEPAVKMACTSCSYSNGTSIYENIVYDEQGRVVSYDYYPDGFYYHYSEHHTFTYYTDRIEEYVNEELSCTYILKNGIISVEDTESYDIYYVYANKRLSTVSEVDDDYSYAETYTWKNGNLLEASSNECSILYEYYDQICPSYIVADLAYGSFPSINPFLADAGYFGIMPKNLMKSMTYFDETGEQEKTYVHTYTFNEYGYPITLTDQNRTYLFTWEKVN